MVTFFRLARNTMLLTEPTSTPCQTTGAPTLRPLTEFSKNMTNLLVFLNRSPLPKMITPASNMAMELITKTPITVLLACLAICFPLSHTGTEYLAQMCYVVIP